MSVQSLESCMSLNCIGIFLPVYVVLHVVRSVHLSWVKFFKSFKTFKYRFRECGFAQITYFAPVKLVFVLYINTIIFLANISRSTICQYFKSDPARRSWIQPCLGFVRLREYECYLCQLEKLVLFCPIAGHFWSNFGPSKKRAGTERLLTIQLFSSGSSLEQ